MRLADYLKVTEKLAVVDFLESDLAGPAGAVIRRLEGHLAANRSIPLHGPYWSDGAMFHILPTPGVCGECDRWCVMLTVGLDTPQYRLHLKWDSNMYSLARWTAGPVEDVARTGVLWEEMPDDDPAKKEWMKHPNGRGRTTTPRPLSAVQLDPRWLDAVQREQLEKLLFNGVGSPDDSMRLSWALEWLDQARATDTVPVGWRELRGGRGGVHVSAVPEKQRMTAHSDCERCVMLTFGTRWPSWRLHLRLEAGYWEAHGVTRVKNLGWEKLPTQRPAATSWLRP